MKKLHMRLKIIVVLISMILSCSNSLHPHWFSKHNVKKVNWIERNTNVLAGGLIGFAGFFGIIALYLLSKKLFKSNKPKEENPDNPVDFDAFSRHDTEDKALREKEKLVREEKKKIRAALIKRRDKELLLRSEQEKRKRDIVKKRNEAARKENCKKKHYRFYSIDRDLEDEVYWENIRILWWVKIDDPQKAKRREEENEKIWKVLSDEKKQEITQEKYKYTINYIKKMIYRADLPEELKDISEQEWQEGGGYAKKAPSHEPEFCKLFAKPLQEVKRHVAVLKDFREKLYSENKDVITKEKWEAAKLSSQEVPGYDASITEILKKYSYENVLGGDEGHIEKWHRGLRDYSRRKCGISPKLSEAMKKLPEYKSGRVGNGVFYEKTLQFMKDRRERAKKKPFDKLRMKKKKKNKKKKLGNDEAKHDEKQGELLV
ncbi:hypothetical protein ACFLYA_02075 [Candidatus Dependentiae bacterium]